MNKINTISASIASAYATKLWGALYDTDDSVLFDSRSFIVPETDVVNYFIWRQKDWIRNSVQMYDRKFYSQNQLHGISIEYIKEMLNENSTPWDDLPIHIQRGRASYKNEDGDLIIDEEVPLFTENWNFIEKHYKI